MLPPARSNVSPSALSCAPAALQETLPSPFPSNGRRPCTVLPVEDLPRRGHCDGPPAERRALQDTCGAIQRPPMPIPPPTRSDPGLDPVPVSLTLTMCQCGIQCSSPARPQGITHDDHSRYWTRSHAPPPSRRRCCLPMPMVTLTAPCGQPADLLQGRAPRTSKERRTTSSHHITPVARPTLPKLRLNAGKRPPFDHRLPRAARAVPPLHRLHQYPAILPFLDSVAGAPKYSVNAAPSATSCSDGPSLPATICHPHRNSLERPS